MKRRILIVEDDIGIQGLIELTLQMEQYETDIAEDGEIAFNKIQHEHYDLILLDIMIPKIDGFTLIKMIEDKRIPVIFLSAKSQLQDKILGLKLGAEDYITKPFEPLELLARIEVVLRRTNEDTIDNIIKYEHIIIHPNERLVKAYGKVVPLTVKEYNLLMMFANNINNVLTREVLLEKIWGYDFFGETRTVDMHVKQLRDKLDLKDYLKTVYKVGYILKS
ncbi:response regulator transcription factor [Clostridium sp. SM-530-WT-3G]|uniref:response regulator transcription factor n=1 Tax=Clostridium sp. SM-530-WT-3G TaxID=2725303 RepID=UPI00145CFE3F|nr:response regulator transcription factor [Clostridium sp. SM-530-WT-3G]NME84355.1 response regulator transcription factor [Clostridium sp. SM-530-WT-3G]